MQLRRRDDSPDVDMLEGSDEAEITDDEQSSKPSVTLRNHRLPLTCLCIDSKDKYAFTASKDGSMIKWCLGSKRILNKVKSIKKKDAETDKKLNEKYHVNYINAIAISSDDKFLATGGWDKKVRIWSPETLNWIHTFTLHRQAITTLAFRRGHHTLYSGSADKSVMIWTLEDEDNRAFVESLIGHESPITSMDTSRRERVLTSGGLDRSIRVWKIVESAQTVYQTNHESVDVVRYIDDQTFVSGGENGEITLWTTMKRTPLFSIKAHESDKTMNASYWVTSLATFLFKQAKKSHDDNELPAKRRKLNDDDVASNHSEDEEDDADDERNDLGQDGVEKGDTSNECCKPKALIASGSCDSKLHIWKLVRNELSLHQSFECPGFINELKFTSDGQRIVAACGTEHRFGRWAVKKGAKNCMRVFVLNKISSDFAK